MPVFGPLEPDRFEKISSTVSRARARLGVVNWLRSEREVRKEAPNARKRPVQFWKPPDRSEKYFWTKKKFVKSTCDIKKQFFLHVIYPRVWIITKQTKRWNMSLGLEEMPPGSERVLCRPRGQRASRLTMQHITPSSSSECSLGKSFFFQAMA